MSRVERKDEDREPHQRRGAGHTPGKAEGEERDIDEALRKDEKPEGRGPRAEG